MSRFFLIIVVALIFSMGLVMIFSATSAEVLDLDLDKSQNQALVRQIYYALIGISLAFFIGKMGYQNLINLSPLFLGFLSILLLLVLIPGIGREVNGSKRWLSLMGFSVQPSEFVKYTIPAFFIHYILKFEGRKIDIKHFLKLIGILSVPMLLILIEPNNGTVGVIGVSILILCLLTRIPFRFWALPLIVFSLIGVIFASQLPYVNARLKVYLHPELDLKGKGHQPYQAKIAAGSGKFLGKGPGNSFQKLSYLPEAQNDYIAAIFAEEFGFLGIVILISLYASIALLGFHIASQCKELGGFYLASSITFLICFQAFLNLGVVSGLLPSTGLNLPWFSQGGSSLMANFIGIGLLLDIERKNHASLIESDA